MVLKDHSKASKGKLAKSKGSRTLGSKLFKDGSGAKSRGRARSPGRSMKTHHQQGPVITSHRGPDSDDGSARRRVRKQPTVLSRVMGGGGSPPPQWSSATSPSTSSDQYTDYNTTDDERQERARHVPYPAAREESWLQRSVRNALSTLSNQISGNHQGPMATDGYGAPSADYNDGAYNVGGGGGYGGGGGRYDDRQQQGGGVSVDNFKCHVFCFVFILFCLTPFIGVFRTYSFYPAPEPFPIVHVVEDVGMPTPHLVLMMLTCFLILGLIYFKRASILARDQAEDYYDMWMKIKIVSLILFIPLLLSAYNYMPSLAHDIPPGNYLDFVSDPLNAAILFGVLLAVGLYFHSVTKAPVVTPPPGTLPPPPGISPPPGPCPIFVPPRTTSQFMPQGFSPYTASASAYSGYGLPPPCPIQGNYY